jgi:hypothetical protein
MTLVLNLAGIKNIMAEMESLAKQTGLFDSISKHEPKSAPGNNLYCSIWVAYVGPARGQSGLNMTTGLLRFNARVYRNFISKPEDDIDSDVTFAALTLMDKFSNEFALGGLVREVDLLGFTGPPLEANAGYLTIDNKMYRVMLVNIPMVVNDLWTQAA